MYLPTGTYTVSIVAPTNAGELVLRNQSGQVLYFRVLAPYCTKLSINIVDAGDYYPNMDIVIESMQPLRKSYEYIKLPRAERKRNVPISVRENPELHNTPARMFNHTGVIEVSPILKTYPPGVQYFILQHEIGHLFYQTEWKADMYALKQYLAMGYNACMALYSLTRIINATTKQNQSRIYRIYRTLKRQPK